MITARLINTDIKATADIACAEAFEKAAEFPAPLYCATITVPPVAKAINTFKIKMFSESTMLTAATAASPDELIIAVLSRLSRTIKV